MKNIIEKNFKELIPQLKIIEEKRIKANRLTFIIRLFFLPFILLILFNTGKYISDIPYRDPKNLIDLLFTLILIQEAIAIYILTDIKTKFKRLTMPTIVKILDNSFSYSMEIPTSNTKTMTFIFKEANLISAEDFISGVFNDIDIEFYEMSIKNKTGSGRYSRTEKIFKGQCYTLKFNKPIPTPVLISTNISKISKSLLNTNKIELEDIEFNNMFNTYSDNEIMSRYILSPQLMDRLKSLKKLKYTKNVHVLFKGKYIYIAIESSKNMFELKTSKSALDINNFIEMTSDFLIINTIIEELKLSSK